MDGSIIIISILIILLWFYIYIYNEHESKYLPVMVKQKHVISQLKDENSKMKSKLKYLQNYKNDVSKTFQILDNELVMINDKIKQQNESLTPQVQSSTQTHSRLPRSLFQTSFTPSILSTLLNSASTNLFNTEQIEQTEQTEQIEQTEQTQQTQQTEQTEQTQQTEQNSNGDLFNIFNRFLTGLNVSKFEFSVPGDSDSDSIQRGSVQFSTNILPLNNSYRQFLLNREQRNPQTEQSNENIELQNSE